MVMLFGTCHSGVPTEPEQSHSYDPIQYTPGKLARECHLFCTAGSGLHPGEHETRLHGTTCCSMDAPPPDITIASHIQNEETKQWDRYGIVVDISKYGHHNQYLQCPGLQQALNYKTGDDNKLLLLLTIL